MYFRSSLAFLFSLRPARLMMFLIQLVVAALNTGHHRKLYDLLKQRGKKQHWSQAFKTNLLRVINNFGEIFFHYGSHLVLDTWLAGNILAHLLFVGYSRFHQSEKIFLIKIATLMVACHYVRTTWPSNNIPSRSASPMVWWLGRSEESVLVLVSKLWYGGWGERSSSHWFTTI